MKTLTGFAPIASIESKILILGSVPGAQSIQKSQYYGHPRNAFWPIMAALFNELTGKDYEARRCVLAQRGIAVWDVIQSCTRNGSLDANIETTSIKPNDFHDFFSEHPNIKTIFFNGATAEKLFKTYVLPKSGQRVAEFVYQRLPSTSPAHANLTLEEKIQIWKPAIIAVL